MHVSTSWRADRYYACTSPGLEADTLKALTATAQKQSGPVTITDITHGSAELRVIGPDSSALLSRLCRLDFSTAAFPNLTAMQSSVAKTTQIIIRCDMGGGTLAFSLIGHPCVGCAPMGHTHEGRPRLDGNTHRTNRACLSRNDCTSQGIEMTTKSFH